MSINGINNTMQNMNILSNGNETQTTGNTFAELLGSYLSLSAGSIGNFSDTSSMGGSSYMDGLMGMGGTSSMMGMGGSDNSLMMMMLMLLMTNQGKNAAGGVNPLSALLGGNGSTSLQQCQHTYVDAYSRTPGVPSASWLVANAPLTNHIGERSAQTYRAVLDQFNVEGNERYKVNKNGIGDTYCNIYVWDASRAMGAEIPHYVDAAGVPRETGGAGIKELDANAVNDWLNTHGATYGWRKATPEEAQAYANQGMPAVTSWKNPSGHGHLQMVSPSENGGYDAQKGVAIAQAGRQLINYGYASDAYSDSTFSQVEYFVHI